MQRCTCVVIADETAMRFLPKKTSSDERERPLGAAVVADFNHLS